MTTPLLSEETRRLTHEDLLRIGFAVLEDHSLAPVFGDAVLECGWVDARVLMLMWRDRKSLWRSRLPPWPEVAYPGRRFIAHQRESARRPCIRWVRACVAVLLCESWQTAPWSPWALAVSNEYWHPWFGLNREGPPTRLAGVDRSSPPPRGPKGWFWLNIKT